MLTIAGLFPAAHLYKVLCEAVYTCRNTTLGVRMQASASCSGLGVFYLSALDAPGEPDMPPGFGHCGGVGTPSAPGESVMPPGFGRSQHRQGQGAKAHAKPC